MFLPLAAGEGWGEGRGDTLLTLMSENEAAPTKANQLGLLPPSVDDSLANPMPLA